MGESVTWSSAPLNVDLWGVYGPASFPTVFRCQMKMHPEVGRVLWGFSVYRRKPGFRTLGVGADWSAKNGLLLFTSKADAFACISRSFRDDTPATVLTPPTESPEGEEP